MDAYATYLNAERRINEGLIRLERSLGPDAGYGPRPEERMEAMRQNFRLQIFATDIDAQAIATP